ncbi:MAG: CapA family protein [Lachnospiraceae bacterium]|nr:CapA family protein [Lachnospiraceae bacterium]
MTSERILYMNWINKETKGAKSNMCSMFKIKKYVAAIIMVSLVCAGCANKSVDMSDTYTTQAVKSEDEIINGSTNSNYTNESSEYNGGYGGISDNSGSTDIQDESQPDNEVSIVMVGDVLLHTRVAESGARDDGTYNFDALFMNVKDDIESADIAIANQEVIIGGSELGISGYPAFNAPYELGDALVNAGFDIILHATNHALDKGSAGINNCINYWRENHPDIAFLGINDSEETKNNIYVTEKNGIKIAILNYTYGTNGIPMPEGMPYAVNLLDEEQIRSDIERAHTMADFVIVCPHWGTEYVLNETDEQEYYANLFNECGVDLVIGTHPHVMEPVKWIEGENNKTLVYYSLGNYVNWTSDYGDGISNRMEGMMAKVNIVKNEDGSVTISDYEAEPVVSHVNEGFGNVTVYRLSDYTDELASQNAIITQDQSFSREYLVNLYNQIAESSDNLNKVN